MVAKNPPFGNFARSDSRTERKKGADILAVSKALRHGRNNLSGALDYLRLNKTESQKLLKTYMPKYPVKNMDEMSEKEWEGFLLGQNV